MAHFAEVNSDNVVTRVLVVPDEQEHRGHDYLATDLKLGGTWIQTSYNGKIRLNFAGIGYTYNAELDAFVPPKCHDVAVLVPELAQWTCEDPSHVIIEGEPDA